MTHNEYSAAPELSRPLNFLRVARGELALSGRIGAKLFASMLKVRHRRSAFGYVWLILPALITAALSSFLTSHNVFAVAKTGLPYPLFVLTGMMAWQLFTEATLMPSAQLQIHRQLIARTRTPGETFVIAGLLDLGLNALIRMVTIVVCFLLVGVELKPSLLLAPIPVAALLAFGTAIGVLIAPLALLYDDIAKGMATLLGFWFFLTPVIYPVPAKIPFSVNPVAIPIEDLRSLAAGRIDLTGAAALIIVALALLAAGWLVFRLARPHLVARLG